MSRRVVVPLLGCVLVMMSACETSNESDDPPGLDRIDGPAQIDPSFDPFATTPPSVTDAGG